MRSTRCQQFGRLSFLLGMAALSLPASGCLAAAVTAGVVGAGAAGYAYYQGAVPRDLPANMDQSWAGVQLALKDLAMPIISAERDNDGARIESRTGDGDKVHITLEPRASRVPADGVWTHIKVRVALLGDSPVSERILKQIETRVGSPAQQQTQQPPPPVMEAAYQVNQQVPVVTGPATSTQPPPSQFGPR